MVLTDESPAGLPAPQPHLEEVGAAMPADTASALAFALDRAGALDDRRPVVLVAARHWMRERGRLFGHGAARFGLDQGRLVLVAVDRETEVLWALEEALKSAAVAGAVGAIAAAPFVATRRLDFAAKSGRAAAVLLRSGPAGDLSAARLRWRVGSAPSAQHPFDSRAPGAARLQAELVRHRGGPLGQWIVEQDDETGRLGLVAGLADHGLVAQPAPFAA